MEEASAPHPSWNRSPGESKLHYGNCRFAHIVSTHAQAWLKLIESKVKESKIRTLDANQLLFTNVFTSVIPFSVLAGCVAEIQAAAVFSSCLFLTSQDFAGITSLGDWWDSTPCIWGGGGLLAVGVPGSEAHTKRLVCLCTLWELVFPTPFVRKWKNRADLQGK